VRRRGRAAPTCFALDGAGGEIELNAAARRCKDLLGLPLVDETRSLKEDVEGEGEVDKRGERTGQNEQ
jgi:hypothetical protein